MKGENIYKQAIPNTQGSWKWTLQNMSMKALIVNAYQVNLDLCFFDFFVLIDGNHGFDNFDMGITKIAMACNL